jgi:Flp pilus assembly protein TadB
MLDLRSRDPERQSADRPVALLAAYLFLAAIVVGAVLGGSRRAIWLGAVLALAGIPWLLAWRGRARLPGEARAGIPFHMRGERPGIWAIAPLAGGALAFAAGGLLGIDSGLLRVALCAAAAAAYTWLLVRVERAYEAAIRLDRLPRRLPPEPEEADIVVRRQAEPASAHGPAHERA